MKREMLSRHADINLLWNLDKVGQCSLDDGMSEDLRKAVFANLDSREEEMALENERLMQQHQEQRETYHFCYRQPFLDGDARVIVADWLLQKAHAWESTPRSFSTALIIFDRLALDLSFLVPPSQMQLLAVVSLSISMKIYDSPSLGTLDLYEGTVCAYSLEQITEMEIKALTRIGWKIDFVSHFQWVDCMARAGVWGELWRAPECVRKDVLNVANFAIDLHLEEESTLKERGKVVACASVVIGMVGNELGMWNRVLGRISKVEKQKAVKVAESMAEMWKNATHAVKDKRRFLLIKHKEVIESYCPDAILRQLKSVDIVDAWPNSAIA